MHDDGVGVQPPGGMGNRLEISAVTTRSMEVQVAGVVGVGAGADDGVELGAALGRVGLGGVGSFTITLPARTTAPGDNNAK